MTPPSFPLSSSPALLHPQPTPSVVTISQTQQKMPSPDLQSKDTYTFPSHRLQQVLSDPTKIPLVLVACGSFSPITHMHLRMFEMAVDYVRQNMSDTYEVVGGYLSPVSDRYNKAGLASATHRSVLPFPFRLHLRPRLTCILQGPHVRISL